MPELPEVETTRAGIAPHITGRLVKSVVVRNSRLRWPVSPEISTTLPGQVITSVQRRAKYLLLHTASGTVLWHLGMSGSLRLVSPGHPLAAHDHLDVVFADVVLRFNDPRRFGSVLWSTGDPAEHPLLVKLGPEPLSASFTAAYLFKLSRGRKSAIKTFIMNHHHVVGVGNIYACEALFRAKINPLVPAGRVSEARYARLVAAIKQVLASAIADGGTTLKDFVAADGQPGYFRTQLQVYGRQNEACVSCQQLIRKRVIGQRSTFYCARCQT